MLDQLRNRLSREYSIPDEIAIEEDTINNYKQKSVQGSISVDQYGGLKWANMEDRDHEVENGCMPPVNKLNTELRTAKKSNAEQNIEKSVFYNMGAAIGLHGEELSEDKPGDPDYETICSELHNEARESAFEGYWGTEPKQVYHEKGPMLHESMIEAARNINDIMEELE